MSDKLILRLDAKTDSEGNKYYVAKLKAPISIDCSEKNGGVSFMIFTSEEGQEELQISHITHGKKKFDGQQQQ